MSVTRLEEPIASFEGRLSNFSGNGLQVVVRDGLSPGTVVKVEWKSTLLLAEVVYCRRKESEYLVGLELEHALYDTESLAPLMEPEGRQP